MRSRQPSTDARLTPPEPDPRATALPETKPSAKPPVLTDQERERWLRVAREWGKPKQEPKMIPTAEAQYLRIMGPGWIDIDQAAREEMERRKRRTPPGWMGDCGDEFSF
jgi:hypothetical protein